ncbi:hypothetical protein DLAC_02162 [Tieghemostelium lacteum]|uniref:Uncharacterized protein n=1 Tax=Tieghemostelium lacteum TaxID=361077 RepID=A0A152A490_TIELA|nr:hypothetical protein DLAC_02162 [Tieghemostelium lacteum]|eukprot:KYR01068.1 hypothetical protein DLAC_02162 [Tieghemostelium lacteum]
MKSYLYSNPNLLKIYLNNGQCLYCGRYNEEINNCEHCETEFTFWQDTFDRHNFTKFQDNIIVFYDWCCLSDEELSQKQHHQSCDQEIEKMPKHLEGNYIIPLLIVIESISNEFIYNKFTQWVDSKSVRQRLISYLFIYKSEDKSALLETVFERMLTDYEVYTILKHLGTYIIWWDLCRGNINQISNSTVDRMMNTLRNQLDSQQIQDHIDCEFLFFMIHAQKLSLDMIVSLLPKVGLKRSGSSSIDTFIKEIKCNEINPSNPISYYSQVIDYCFYEMFYNVIDSFYHHYGSNLTEYYLKYLNNNLDSTSYLEDKFIFDKLAGIISYKQFNIKPNSKISQFIKEYIVKKEKLFKLLYFADTNDPIFDAFFTGDAKISNLNDQFYILYHNLKSENLVGDKLNIYLKKLRLNVHIEYYYYAFKFFSNDMEKLKEILDGIWAPTFEEYPFPNETNFGDLMTFIESLDSIGYQSAGIDNAVLISIYYCTDGRDIQIEPRQFKLLLPYYMRVFQENVIPEKTGKFNRILNTLGTFKSMYLHPDNLTESKELLLKLYQFFLKSNHYLSESVQHNLLLILNQLGHNVSEYILAKKVKLSYDLIVNIPMDNVTMPISMMDIQSNLIIPRLFEEFYVEGKSIPPHIYQLCEWKLASSLAPFISMDKLYQDIVIENGDEEQIKDLYRLVLYKHNREGCLKSKLFQKFYFSLPHDIIVQMGHNRTVYQLEILKRSYQNDTSSVTETNNINNHVLPSLPKLLISKIIHCVYYDPTVIVIEKIELSTVSRLWFDICSDILTNHYYEDSLTLYIAIKRFRKINIESKYCLFKFYPKVINFNLLYLVPYKYIDRYLHEHMETMIIGMKNPEILYLEKSTNLKNLEIQLSEYFDPQYLMYLIERSPLLSRIDLILCNMNELKRFLDTTIESILKLERKNLLEINIHATENFIFDEISVSNLENIYTHLPSFNLKSIPSFVEFSGFKSVNIEFNHINEQHQWEEFTEFYKIPLSFATDKIQFTFIRMDNTNDIPNFIDYVNKNHRTQTLCIKLCQKNSISTQLVQSIFDQLNQTQNIKSFSMYTNSISNNSFLLPNQWSQINLHKFKYSNYNFTHFYQSLN